MTAPQHSPLPCTHLSVTIGKDFETVYGWLAEPANWTHWASGLGRMHFDAATNTWTAQQDGTGVVTIVFTPRNAFGVLDHTVTTAEGKQIHVPMRAIRNAAGTEVIFTLFRLPEMDDATWARDQEWVRKDLEALRSVM